LTSGCIRALGVSVYRQRWTPRSDVYTRTRSRLLAGCPITKEFRTTPSNRRQPFIGMIAAVASATLNGALGCAVSVEVHVSNGLPGFTIVGLPDAAVREARDRVRAAVLSSGLSWPMTRVTVNLAPSGVRKAGAGLDLPIAVGLLVATGDLPADCIEGFAFCGELGLNGSLRHVPGMLALADAARSQSLVVPLCDVQEAALVLGAGVRGAATLAQLVSVLRSQAVWPVLPEQRPPAGTPPGPDLAEIRGQVVGRRALEVAAAGRHHLLLIGPPGSGKTMLAERLPSLLPPLTKEEALTVSRVHSSAGAALPEGGLLDQPPFRAPHHQATIVSLVGGGNLTLRPGEASLAAHGILFLDELGEFSVAALEALRQPLEEGVIRVNRAGGTVTFPADFLLVAAMNPCPCGEGVFAGACKCSVVIRSRYRRRISAPFLDRFDLVVPVTRPSAEDLLSGTPGESSAEVAARVTTARSRAATRGDADVVMTPDASDVLRQRLEQGALSARGLNKVKRVAQTVADLEGADVVDYNHVAEALSLRAGRSAVIA
jgi:magnesium chelatase family protein